MTHGAAIVLLAVTCLGLAASMFAWLGLGFARLESRLGFLRDGLPVGARAPKWTVIDSEGVPAKNPSGRWQVLLFGDHSLVEFPDLQLGLVQLADAFDIDLLIAARYDAEVVSGGLRADLQARARLLSVPQRFYDRHNVRAMPLIMLIDPAGRITGNGMFDNAASIVHLATLAGAKSRRASTAEPTPSVGVA